MAEGQKIPRVVVAIIFLSQLGWTQAEGIFLDVTPPRIYELETALYKSSTHQSVCMDACSYDELKSYYWCNTDKGRDYCSPTHDVTYKDEPCRSDHPCDTHGYSYTWCRTDSGWDYCGLIETAGVYSITRRQKRDTKGTLVHTENNGQNDINFYSFPNEKNIADGKQWKTEIEELILCWSNNCLSNRAGCRLNSKNFRIDQQGQFKDKNNNKQYFNLQIQQNVPRQNSKVSTTVAQVIMENNDLILDSHTQRAFQLSLENRAKITVEVLSDNNKKKKTEEKEIQHI